MTPHQKKAEAKRQIRAMLRDAEADLFAKLDKAISAAPEEYFEGGNYLLAKAVLDSWMRERGYAGLNARTKKEFDNIHLCC